MRAIAWMCGGLLLACGSSHVSGGTGSSAGQRVLHLHFSGGGSGQVRSATPGFTCSAGCDQSIAAGATVHIDAVPAGGSRFDGWSGACSGTGGCDVAMDADHDVTAAFSTLPPPPPSSSRLTVVMIGKGSGRVTSSPAGIDCASPATCLLTVATGSSVSLSESADANSTFIGWGGGCSGAGGCNVTVTGETVVWANFDAKGPPPPPPASCAGLTPATGLASVMHSIPRSAAGGAVCFPGIGDSTGTLGLITRGGDSIGSARTRTFYFVEETGGREKTSMAFLGSSGAYEVYTQQPDGFLVVFFVPSGPESFSIEHFDHDGRIGSNGARAPMMGKPAIKESPLGGILLAGDFTIRNDTTPVTLLHQACFVKQDASISWCAALASRGTVFGLGTDVNGRSLVITDGGSGNVDAQWFDTNGAALTSSFRLITGFQAGANTWFDTAPLIGGGFAVRRVDLQKDAQGADYTTSQWLVIASSGTAVQSAPQWLTSRPNTNLAIARGSRAYALLPLGAPDASCAQSVEVLAADGTSCGSLSTGDTPAHCRTEDVGLALDGTPIQLVSKDLSASDTCSYRWWPQALR